MDIGRLHYEASQESHFSPRRNPPLVQAIALVVEVLIAQRDAADAMGQQSLDAVLDQVGITVVLEAGGEAAGQDEHLVGGARQQRTGVRGDGAAVE